MLPKPPVSSLSVRVVSPYHHAMISRELRRLGFSFNRKTPDFIITYGGDGTILQAEQRYPGIPKIPIRKQGSISSRCAAYPLDDLDSILQRLEAGSYKIKEEPKVEARAKGRRMLALNEVQIHNLRPFRALRFSVEAGGRKIAAIGDGIVVATPYGSTGYYQAIGGRPFKTGIRIGFNNAVGRPPSIALRGTAAIRIRREDCWVAADNNPRMARLRKGDLVTIRQAKERALFVVFG